MFVLWLVVPNPAFACGNEIVDAVARAKRIEARRREETEETAARAAARAEAERVAALRKIEDDERRRLAALALEAEQASRAITQRRATMGVAVGLFGAMVSGAFTAHQVVARYLRSFPKGHRSPWAW